MNLPNTPIPVVFKRNKSLNKTLTKDVTTIKSSTRMCDLPHNSVIVWGDKKGQAYRLTGNNGYQYASIAINQYTDHRTGQTGTYVELGGHTHSFELLNQYIETVNLIQPFINQVYN